MICTSEGTRDDNPPLPRSGLLEPFVQADSHRGTGVCRLTQTLGVCRLNLQSFVECADVRLPNRLLCASAGSVCVTSLSALISSQGQYA